jgi:L-iditol 2-dehydrogenase
VRAIVAGAPGQIDWIEMSEPAVEPGGVVLRPLACGVCTTDVKQVRAGYKEGPRYVLGHELAAEVVAAGEGAGWQVGDRVVAAPYLPCGQCAFCRRGQPTLCPHLFAHTLNPGALAERVAIPAALAERGLFALPSHLALSLAALAEPIGCCVQAVETCCVQAGTSVLVVGDGPMGLMNAAVARAYGANPVIVAGITPARLAVARQHYADAVIDVSGTEMGPFVREWTEGRGADVVIVAVSSAEAVENGLKGLRPGGVLNAFAGVPEGTTIRLDLRRLHYDQWHLTGSFGVAPVHIQKAVQLLAHAQLDAAPLVTGTFAFEDTARAIAYSMNHEGLKAVVLFDS